MKQRSCFSMFCIFLVVIVTWNVSCPLYAEQSENMRLAGGDAHALYAHEDGSVFAWGKNEDGQLGIGETNRQESSPVQVHGENNIGFFSDVVALAAGQSHSIALKTDGTVWSFGNGGAGRLGTGDTTASSTPVQIHALSNIVSIVAGHMHALALGVNGIVSIWGKGESGKPELLPRSVQGLTNVIAICAGDGFSVVAKDDGSVWTWGNRRCCRPCNVRLVKEQL